MPAFSRFAVVATAICLSQAFLLPPSVSVADSDVIQSLPFEDAIVIDGRVLDLNCPACPVIDTEGKIRAVELDSILQLNFTLDHLDTDHLLLNGLQIYPIESSSPAFMQPLTASQMIQNDDKTWEYASTARLGYSMNVRHTAQDQIDLITIHVEILEVSDIFLTGIPAVELQLLATPTGKLMIGNAEINSPKAPLFKPTEDGKECSSLICKWEAIITNVIAKAKGAAEGCASKAQTHAPPRPFHTFSHPQPHGPYLSHHHPHHTQGGYARFLRGIVLHVLIPILIGIMFGITASILGMAVGHVLVFAWRLFFRRSEAEYISINQPHIVDMWNAGHEGSVKTEGPPPQYETVLDVKSEK